MARDQAQLLEMGERIRQLRESHGYKQQWIADQIGVTLRSYQFWQAGKSPPEQENLAKLAELFDVTPTYILQGETPDLSAPQNDDLREQLDRMEQKLTIITGIIEQLAASLGETLLAEEQAAQQARQTAGARARRQAS